MRARAFCLCVRAGISMLQQATRMMAEAIPRDRWRDVIVRVTSSAIEMFSGSVSGHECQCLKPCPHSRRFR